MAPGVSGLPKRAPGKKLINSIMSSLNPYRNHIGLDISEYKIRFIQFHTKGSKKIKVNSFGEVTTPPGLISAGIVKNENKVAILIKKLIGKPKFGKVDTRYVNTSLPEKRTFLKTFEIPNVPDNELKGAVSWGIEQNIPVAIDNIHFDWQIVSSSLNNKKKKIKVLAVAAPRNIADSYTRIIKKANLIPICLENESIPIARCLIDQKQKTKSSLLITDIGKSRTSLIIYSDNNVQFTSSIEIGGYEMTEAVAKIMKLNIEDAEKAKIIYGLDKKKARGTIRKVLEPIINRLASRIKENIDYFNNYVSAESKINTILLTGSVSQTLGLTKFLQENLKLNVLLGDPWTNLTSLKTKQPAWKNIFFSFSTAIGLALKKFD
jgi:type IV pilus assembly protein PilM